MVRYYEFVIFLITVPLVVAHDMQKGEGMFSARMQSAAPASPAFLLWLALMLFIV